GRGAQDGDIAAGVGGDEQIAEQFGQPVGAAGDAADGTAVLGDDVDARAAVGRAQLDRTEFVEITRQRGLGGRDALGGQQRGQLGLAAHGVRGEQFDDAGLAARPGAGDGGALPVGGAPAVDGAPGTAFGDGHAHSATPSRFASSHTSRAFCACSRFSASSQTALCGPSMTSSVISSPRCAGRQCSTTTSGAACSSSAVSRRYGTNGPTRSKPSFSWPMEVQVSVTRACAPRAAATGSPVTVMFAPVSAARLRAASSTQGRGSKPAGAAMVTSSPAVTPPSSSECAMLLAPSPK